MNTLYNSRSEQGQWNTLYMRYYLILRRLLLLFDLAEGLLRRVDNKNLKLN